MRHYRIPVAIAVGLATALAAGATGVAKTTPAVSAKPAAADTAAKLMAEHRGGTLKLLAKAAGGSLDPQVNYTLAVLAALSRDAGRPRHVQGRRRRRRVRDRARPRRRHPEADRRRQDVDVQAAQGHQVLERQGRDAEGRRSTRSSASSRCTRPTAGGFYSVHHGRRQVPQDARHVRSLEVRRDRRRRPTRVTFHLDAAGRRVARQARRAARGAPARRDAQQGPRHEARRPAPAPTCSRSTTRTTS